MYKSEFLLKLTFIFYFDKIKDKDLIEQSFDF